MPEIYVCLQNLRYKYGMLPAADSKFTQKFKNFEFSIALNMEQNRRKLFGC